MLRVCFFSFLLSALIVATLATLVPTSEKTTATIDRTIGAEGRFFLI
jgi:hypothetical protein